MIQKRTLSSDEISELQHQRHTAVLHKLESHQVSTSDLITRTGTATVDVVAKLNDRNSEIEQHKKSGKNFERIKTKTLLDKLQNETDTREMATIRHGYKISNTKDFAGEADVAMQLAEVVGDHKGDADGADGAGDAGDAGDTDDAKNEKNGNNYTDEDLAKIQDKLDTFEEIRHRYLEKRYPLVCFSKKSENTWKDNNLLCNCNADIFVFVFVFLLFVVNT